MLVVTGIDTDIGKTLLCAWLCIHTRWAYWKPIQTGAVQGSSESDSYRVRTLANVEILPEKYIYKKACSPHEASALEGEEIVTTALELPQQPTIIEGVGGVCVPLTMKTLFIDLLCSWSIPTVLVSSGRLGTINHTLLTLEALQNRSISVLGIIINGEYNIYTHKAIERYSNIPIVGYFPYLSTVTSSSLESIPLPQVVQEYVDRHQRKENM